MNHRRSMRTQKLKQCTKCHETKRLTEFYKQRGGKYYASACKVCHKRQCRARYASNPEKYRSMSEAHYRKNSERYKISARNWKLANPKKTIEFRRKAHLKHEYGITPEEYALLLASQGGVCAICGNTETRTRKNRNSNEFRELAVDHDHSTGLVRGILCSLCNTGLAHFKDNIRVLKNAISYLEKHGALRTTQATLGQLAVGNIVLGTG